MAIGLFNCTAMVKDNTSVSLVEIVYVSMNILLISLEFIFLTTDIISTTKCFDMYKPGILHVCSYIAAVNCLFINLLLTQRDYFKTLSLRTTANWMAVILKFPILMLLCTQTTYMNFYHQLLMLSGDIEPHPGPPPTNQLSICHLNIRSLSTIKLLAIKHQLIQNFDIITLSETFLSNDTLHDLSIEGFHPIIRKDRDAHGGGVAAYVSLNLIVKRCIEYEVASLECLWLEIHSKNNKFLLATCYRPPRSKDDYWEDLQYSMDIVKTSNFKNIILTGDFNADLRTCEGNKLVQFTNNNELFIHIKEPTRITEQTATILDQFLTNIPHFITDSNVHAPLSTNDHCTISIKVTFKMPKGSAYHRHIWLYDRADFVAMNHAIQMHNWDDCFDKDDIDISCHNFNTSFLNIARQFIPNKIVEIRTKDKPWYTAELRKLKRTKDRLHKIAKSSRKGTDWANFRASRNIYSSRLRETVELHKTKLAGKLKDTQKSDPKSWWHIARQFLGKVKENIIPPMQKDNTSYFDTQAKANAFNEAFLSFSKIDTRHANLPPFSYITEGRIDTIEVTEDIVRDVLKGLNVSKATGPDGISAKMLKETANTICVPLTSLIKLSLSMGKVPMLWKQANVLPIHKKDEKSVFGNYRPVSLLNIIAKVTEKIVFKDLFNYIRDFDILTLHQSGFVPNDSTVHQLVYLYHTFCKALNDKKDIRIVFCDQSKAFDRVWHCGLLFKLKTIGVTGALLQWFKSYLSNRMQRVVINGKHSGWGLIEAGVPQGSVLGPLLFLIYINDITKGIKSAIKLFADDTSLYITFDNNIQEATDQLNNDMSTISEWANQWLVTFNPTKTKALLVTLKRNLIPPPLYFNRHPLENVKCHKHLGLQINETLSWKEHINSISAATNKKVNVLSSLGKILDRKTLLTMYTAFIRPSLEYGSIVWCNCTNDEDDVLEAVQRRAARVISGAIVRTHTACIYQELGLETLKARRNKNILFFFHQIINGNSPAYLFDLLPPIPENTYNLRRQNNYPVPRCRLTKFQNSFLPKAINLWNNLDERIKTIIDHDAFRKALDGNKAKDNVLYQVGNRKETIFMARMRLNCSDLKGHLYKLKIIDTSQCQCGYKCEDSYHFLFVCPLYNRPRAILQNTVTNLAAFTLKTVLFGRDILSENNNKLILQATITYINDTKRFEV